MIKPVRFVCGVGLLLSLLACGGGGASVSQNQFAGTWSGTGTWRTYNSSGVPNGSAGNPIPIDGTVSGTGEVNIKLHFPDQVAGFHDNMRGTVTEGGTASGAYLDAVIPGTQAGFLFSYNAVFTRIGNQLTIVYQADYSPGNGSARGTLTINLQ